MMIVTEKLRLLLNISKETFCRKNMENNPLFTSESECFAKVFCHDIGIDSVMIKMVQNLAGHAITTPFVKGLGCSIERTYLQLNLFYSTQTKLFFK